MQETVSDKYDLTKGPIRGKMLHFALPVCAGQLLQQLYNTVDAWVIGQFADNDAFAAVSTMGIVVFLIIGFCIGMSMGGSVIISRYYGSKDPDLTSKAIHSHYLMAAFVSAGATVLGLIFAPRILVWIGTPASVMPHAKAYLIIYFAGVSTVIFYNMGMSVLRSLGDSFHPLCYLIFSTFLNILLDLLFVACPIFRWGVSGAALATVISQGVSAILCITRQMKQRGYMRLTLSGIRLYPSLLREMARLGLPSGIQNSVLTIGNLVVQKNVNAFGTYAMSGFGAYVKIESFVFVPILSMSQTLPTFISQNLGAGRNDRARRGAIFGTGLAVICAGITGVLISICSPVLLRIFIRNPQALSYGIMHSHIVPLFYGLLAFAHCSAGILRGCKRAFFPMLNMLIFWCAGRVLYVTIAIQIRPVFTTISWAYPLAWGASGIVFLYLLTRLPELKASDSFSSSI